MIQIFDRNRYLKIMEPMYVGCDSTIRNNVILRENIYKLRNGTEMKSLFFFFFFI